MEEMNERYIKIYFYQKEEMPPLTIPGEDGEKIGYEIIGNYAGATQPMYIKAFSGKRTILIPMERIKFIDMKI